jgi:hypothetical protein
MSRKRGRDEEGPPVKVEEATRSILRIIGKWRDACDAEYNVRSKVETREDASVLRVGTFDELTCERIVSVLDASLPGDYCVSEMHCDMTKRSLVFTLRRNWCSGGASKDARTIATTVPPAEDVSQEFLKMRVGAMVTDKDDAQTVSSGMGAIMRHLARGTTWTLATTPSFYVVSFKLTDPKLSAQAVRAAASSHAAAVDFERSTLRVSIAKAHPDIV